MTPVDLPAFHKLILKIGKHQNFRGRLLSIDPGETSGISIFEHDSSSTTLIHVDQQDTWPIEQAVDKYTYLLRTFALSFVVYESYYIYAWRLDQHKFNEVPTIQIIGCLKTLCIQRSILLHAQTAQIGKGFVSDQKLKDWNLWDYGKVHSRDSMRHAAQFLLFGRTQK